MLASFLLSLREGLEAALIIGIVLGVLLKLKRTDLNKKVWQGAGVGAALSVAAAIVLTCWGWNSKAGERRFSKASPCCWRRAY
jgi:FTR1 family protein